MSSNRKRLGQFFTPGEVAASLVKWVAPNPATRLLDPSCGDGAFLRHHKKSVGIELDPAHAWQARENAPSALVHCGDFFGWAAETRERFEAIAGNPPFIRYQSFSGTTRAQALAAASLMEADFSALTSSWAPFLLVAAGLLRPGGRMAFVVPAEIGHANYSKVLIEALCGHFSGVRIVACRRKLFPEISEDCWLLFCEGFGGRTEVIGLTTVDEFVPSSSPPSVSRTVPLSDWRSMGGRLRPFLLPSTALSLYQEITCSQEVRRFGELASANIGYVSGANDFFHLRPSEVAGLGIPREVLSVTIRKASQLSADRVEAGDIERWIASDEPVFLLNLKGVDPLPEPVRKYLASDRAEEARSAYKCRTRSPWFAVPDVKVPDGFLTVMNGRNAALVKNDAGCVCTNSLHAVRLREGANFLQLQEGWKSPLAALGAEIEGHPLGGGMLKLEPKEVAQIPIPGNRFRLSETERETLLLSIDKMREWRRCDSPLLKDLMEDPEWEPKLGFRPRIGSDV